MEGREFVEGRELLKEERSFLVNLKKHINAQAPLMNESGGGTLQSLVQGNFSCGVLGWGQQESATKKKCKKRKARAQP